VTTNMAEPEEAAAAEAACIAAAFVADHALLL
jgi:hypothetical protein